MASKGTAADGASHSTALNGLFAVISVAPAPSSKQITNQLLISQSHHIYPYHPVIHSSLLSLSNHLSLFLVPPSYWSISTA